MSEPFAPAESPNSAAQRFAAYSRWPSQRGAAAAAAPLAAKLERYWIVFCRLGTFVLVALLSIFVIARCFSSIGGYDGLYNAKLPKNFVIGAGYKTTYPAKQAYADFNKADQDRYFNVEVTTGPGLLFWSVPFFAIFGSEYWVPAVAAASLSLILLIGSFAALRRTWLTTPEAFWPFSVITLLLLVASTADVYYPGIAIGLLRPWHELIGEIPASLYLMIGAILLFSSGERASRAALAGIFFSLGILTKSLEGIIAAVVLGCYAGGLLARGYPWRTIASSSIIALAGTILPFLGYQALIFLTMPSPQAYEEWAVANHTLMSWAGSGIGPLDAAPGKAAYLIGKFAEHSTSLLKQFSAWQIAIVAGVALTLAAMFGARAIGSPRSLKTVEALGLTLLLAAGAHYVWWMFLEDQGWIRHLIQANVALAFALGLLVVQVRAPIIRFSVFFLLLVAAMPALSQLMANYRIAFHKDRELASMLQVLPILEERQKQGYILLGCDWAVTREFDFVLPGPGDMFDCTGIQPAGWKKPAILVRGPYWFLVSKMPAPAEIQRACEQNVLISNTDYTISACPVEAVEKNYLWPGFDRSDTNARLIDRQGLIPILSAYRDADLNVSLGFSDPERATHPVVGRVTVRYAGNILFERPISISRSSHQEIVIPKDIVHAADAIMISIDGDVSPDPSGNSSEKLDIGLELNLRQQ